MGDRCQRWTWLACLAVMSSFARSQIPLDPAEGPSPQTAASAPVPSMAQPEVLVNASFTIIAPNLIRNMTTAAASPDLIRAMLQSVAVESVATSLNVTVDLDEGNALANILAFGSRTMQNSMIGGCCDQYGSILRSLTNNSDLVARINNTFAGYFAPSVAPQMVGSLQYIAPVSSRTTNYDMALRLIGLQSSSPISNVDKARNGILRFARDQQASASVDMIVDASSQASGAAGDLMISLRGWPIKADASQLDLASLQLPDVFQNLSDILTAADPAFKLLFLKLTPQDPALGPAPSAASSLPPSVAPRPASVPGPGFPNKALGNATIEIRMQLTGSQIVPFTSQKQDQVRIATAAYFAALNIKVDRPQITDFIQSGGAPSPSGQGQRRLHQSNGGPPSAGLTEIPNVNVTLRLVISAEDLYRLSQNTSNAPTASLSFEQVMSAQGIVVRAALLAARVVAADSLPSSPPSQSGATDTASGSQSGGRQGQGCTGGGGANCPVDQGTPPAPSPTANPPGAPQLAAALVPPPAAPPQAAVTAYTSRTALSTSGIILIAVLVPVAVILAVVLALLLITVKRRRKRGGSSTAYTQDTYLGSSFHMHTHSSASMPSSAPAPHRQPVNYRGWPDFSRNLLRTPSRGDSRSLQMAATSQFNETGLAEVLIFAVTHLSEDAIFLRNYRMGAERWRSTTCLMCCATKMSASPPLEVLLKFFGNDSDFDREVGVTGSFQNHCPVVHGVYPARDLAAEYDEDRVPACIVTDRPICTLQEWLLQADIDWLLSDKIATFYSIVKIVKDLHARDYVLCDLSPTNIAWFDSPDLVRQPGDQGPGWRLLTASQSHRKGQHAKPVTAVKCAAPEIAMASRKDGRQEYVQVSSSIDCWALGLIAHSIFTGTGMFDGRSEQEVRMMLRNKQPLPFEVDAQFWSSIQPHGAAALIRNLLQRRAILRLNADDVIQALQALAATTSMENMSSTSGGRTTPTRTIPSSGHPRTQGSRGSSDSYMAQLQPWLPGFSPQFAQSLNSISHSSLGSEMNTQEIHEGKRLAEQFNESLPTRSAKNIQ